MRRAFVMAAILGLAACQPGTPEDTTPEDGWDEAARAECIAAGGTPTLGLAGPACAMPTPDAGRACVTTSDCSGLCMAETMTCSPVTPMFGCHAIIEDNEVVELCID